LPSFDVWCDVMMLRVENMNINQIICHHFGNDPESTQHKRDTRVFFIIFLKSCASFCHFFTPNLQLCWKQVYPRLTIFNSYSTFFSDATQNYDNVSFSSSWMWDFNFISFCLLNTNKYNIRVLFSNLVVINKWKSFSNNSNIYCCSFLKMENCRIIKSKSLYEYCTTSYKIVNIFWHFLLSHLTTKLDCCCFFVFLFVAFVCETWQFVMTMNGTSRSKAFSSLLQSGNLLNENI
jgi:hypothetical protein